jgi:uncharacterized protein involved in exopolysaccharide biosynthesis
MSPATEQDNFHIMNYLKIFFRRKKLFILPTFFGLVVGICAGIILPKKYMSSTIILVEEGKTDNPLFDDIAVSTTVRERLTTIRESMLGWNSLVELVKRLNLDKTVKTPKQYESLIMGIRDAITIKLRGNNIIHLSYEGLDAVQTQAVVKNITDIFIQKNVEIQNRETQDAIVFIEGQLKVYKSKIKSAEIAKMQEELTELLVDSTEKHPLVKQLRDNIANKKKELEKENLPFIEGEELGFASTNPIIDSIKKALGTMDSPTDAKGTNNENSDFAKIILMEKVDDVMARDVAVNERIYNMLLQRLETAKITQRLQSSKEGTKYTILEPARVPLEPYKPDQKLVALVGLAAGAILGFVLVFLAEMFDKSFIDVEEAKEYLGGPLLGAISIITTEESIRQEKEMDRWVYALSFLGGVVLVVLTITLSNFLS